MSYIDVDIPSIEEIKNVDLKRGFKALEEKHKNLEGILYKLDDIMDVSSFRDEMETIVRDAYSNEDLKLKMPDETMQMDWEGSVLNDYVEHLTTLTKAIEKEYLPVYGLYLFICKINDDLKRINNNMIGDDVGESIGNAIDLSKKLLDSINAMDTHNDPIKNDYIQKSYKMIYSVILMEEIFDRSELLDYVKKLNIASNRENIGRYISQDIKNVSSSDIVDEELKNLEQEGLGYDFLSRDFIQKLTSAVIGEKSEEYQRLKRNAYSQLRQHAIDLSNERNALNQDLKREKKTIRELFVNKSLLRVKFLSLFLIPVIMITSGFVIGKSKSDKILEYKTVTRTVNTSTGEIVGEPDIVYDEHETTYVATVVEYSPWRQNPAGSGFIRNAVTYEYQVPEGTDEDFRASLENIEGNLAEKYRYVESKESLGPNDSTKDSVVYIIETYQDKNVTQKSKKYIIPFELGGIFLGVLISVILCFTGIIEPYEIQGMINKLSEKIKDKRLDEDGIKHEIKLLQDQAISLRSDYQRTAHKYGKVEDSFFTDNELSSWIIKNNNSSHMFVKKKEF